MKSAQTFQARIARALSLTLIALGCLTATSIAQKRQASNPSGAVSDETLARILSNIQARLETAGASLKFPGATVGFALPDGRSASASTGFADLKTRAPLKASDRLLAGSIGKTFVATEVMMLVREGKLVLDDKIERWL